MNIPEFTRSYLPNENINRIFPIVQDGKVDAVIAIYNHTNNEANIKFIIKNFKKKIFDWQTTNEAYNYLFNSEQYSKQNQGLGVNRIHCIIDINDNNAAKQLKMLEAFGYAAYIIPHQQKIDCIYTKESWFNVKYRYSYKYQSDKQYYNSNQ